MGSHWQAFSRGKIHPDFWVEKANGACILEKGSLAGKGREGDLLVVIMATERGALAQDIRAGMLQQVQSQGQDQQAAGAPQAPTGSWWPG